MTDTNATNLTLTLDQLEGAFAVHSAAVAAALADATAAIASARSAGKVTATTIKRVAADALAASLAERRAGRVADKIADALEIEGEAAMIAYAIERCEALVRSCQSIDQMERAARTELRDRLNPTAPRRVVTLTRPVVATLVRPIRGGGVRKDDVVLGRGDVLTLDPKPDRATGRIAVTVDGARHLLQTTPDGLEVYLARVEAV